MNSVIISNKQTIVQYFFLYISEPTLYTGPMKTHAKVTMKDLAQETGLSVSVVSRVLNGKATDYRIREETQRLVQDTASRLGFSVNRVARGLRLQRSHTIGLIIPDISNSFFSKIARSVEKSARSMGYSTILCDTENDEELERHSLKLLRDQAVDGLLIAPVGTESSHIEDIQRSGMPMVLIDRFFESVDVPYVTSDNFAGAYEAVTHLIDRGHKAIVYVQGVPNSKPNLERLRGYRQALHDRGITFREDFVRGNSFDEQDGYESTHALLSHEPGPTALFVSSAVGSLGAMRACMDLGRSIPEDVSIIGFDEYPYAQLLSPPLSTIAQSTETLGERASTMLLDWLENGERPKQDAVVLDTTLVSRRSVQNVTQEIETNV